MGSYRKLERRQIAVEELQPGMYVCELDRPWSESSFLFQGFPLRDEAEIRELRRQCRYVFIDETRAIDVPPPLRAASPLQLIPTGPQPPTAGRRVALAEEADRAKSVWQSGRNLADDLLKDVARNQPLPIPEARALVRQCVDSLLRNENALLWFTRLKTRDEYTALHCLSVAVLAAGFARALGHSESEMEEIGLAGLLHDVGKMKIDVNILNKPARLTAEEYAHVKQHAQIGYELLLQQQGAPGVAIESAWTHHERMDGNGYPRGLPGEKIPYFGRLIAIVDAYDAITSHRVYDPAHSVLKAVKILVEESGTHFDAELVKRFVDWLGVFPVGTLVELQDGEVGVVVATNPAMRLKPCVLVVRDAAKQPCAPVFLDLAKLGNDRNGQPWRIRDSLPQGAYGIELTDLEARGLFSSRHLQTSG